MKIRTNTFCTIMLTIILISTLSVAFNLKFVGAETGEKKGFDDFLKETNEAAPSSKNDIVSPAETSDDPWYKMFQKNQSMRTIGGRSHNTPPNSEDKGEVNEIDGWNDFAFVDGNLTRIIVGINNKELNSYLQLEKLVYKYDGKIVNTVTTDGKIIAAVVEVSIHSVSAFTQNARAAEFTSYIEPNVKFQISLIPNDPYWSYQWAPAKIEADCAWNTTLGDPSILVAVVDTGIDYNHEDLAANYVPGGSDWVNTDTDPMDDHGHGTRCAGIIAAEINNTVGIAGLAQIRIMAEKALDQYGEGYTDWLANAIIHATDQGANIISMSWGGYWQSELIHEAIQYAYNASVLLVAAAGNENTDLKLYPAAYDEVIAVTATDMYDERPGWSNFGDWVELAAPGVNIYSTVPWGYDYATGTSMASPHVAGVAALAWSQFPNTTRDWLRLWLRYTVDDIGDPGFDIYYGYGRINARKAVEETPPEHELIIIGWKTPPYVKPSSSGIINATIVNFGENDESDMEVQLLTNGTLVDSAFISFLASDTSTTVSCSWSPTVAGLYNVTLYVVPVPSEISTGNNVVWKYIFVGVPLKAVVLDSEGTDNSAVISSWQALNINWHLFGTTMIYIDYVTLNKESITYHDIASTEADVLIIPSAWDRAYGWEFTDLEIEAIKQYVLEGHGLIVTEGTFCDLVPNNKKLAPLVGLSETITGEFTDTDLLHLLNPAHPLFIKIPNPFVFRRVWTMIPSDGKWDSNELAGGMYVAKGQFEESAIVTYRGLVYIAPWLEVIPPYYHHHLQLLYNAITWSIYQKPEHDLAVSLDAPSFLEPGTSSLLNATVTNPGLNNETDVELFLMIDGSIVNSTTIPELLTGHSHTITYLWTPTLEGAYNVTAYASPVPDEEIIANNRAAKFVTVTHPLIRPIEGQYANYTIFQIDISTGTITATGMWNFTYVRYISPYQINITMLMIDPSGYIQSGWMIVNIMNRMVERDSGIYWAGMWYPGWIETNVTIGSTINLLDSAVTIVDSEIILVGNRPIDCWKIQLEQYEYVYAFWYDKASGLWIGMEATGPYTMRMVLAETNIPIGFMYEHDLAVMLDAPSYLEPSETTILNATVYNIGLSNETGVELRILVNDTTIDTNVIPLLEAGFSYTHSYLWTPMVEGVYNVTAYAPPVPGENFTLNNAKSAIVHVQVLPDIIIVNDNDGDSWINGTSLSEFEMALTTAGYDYFVWNESSMGNPPLDFLTKFKLVIWTCGDYWNWAVDQVDAATLKSYLAQGGNILLEGEDISYNHDADNFMVNVAHAIYQVDDTGAPGLTVTDPTHPVTFGLPTSFAWLTAPPYDDGVSPTNGGAEEIQYTGTTWTAVTVFEGTSNGSVVYYAFPLYCLAQSHGETLAINSINWLLGVRYKHELAVRLEAPHFLEPDDSSLLNATVYNRGLSNETDVKLFLLINGTVFNNVTIPELINGTSYTIDYLWTPTVEAAYNVTAYAPPVPSENVTANNIMSVMVYVRYVEVALISDGSELLAITSILDSMGIGYDIYNDNSFYLYTEDLNLLLDYSVVIFNNYDRLITSDEHSALESYLAAGGNLLVTGYDSLGNPSDPLLADIVHSSSIGDNTGEPDLYVMDASHPIMNGPYGSFPAGYHITGLYGDCDAAEADTGRNAITVAELADGYDKIIATGFQLGKVVYWNGKGPDDWIRNSDCEAMLKNILSWMVVKYEHDLAVTLEAPTLLQLGDSSLLNVTVHNRGLHIETVELQLLINGSVANLWAIPDLSPGESTLPSSFLWTPTQGGMYNVTAYVPPLLGEEYLANNVASRYVGVGVVPPGVTAIYVAPYNTTVMLRQNFTITIMVANVEDLYVWQVKLYFNSTVLNCTSAWTLHRTMSSQTERLLHRPP